jgi:hypothetical protein
MSKRKKAMETLCITIIVLLLLCAGSLTVGAQERSETPSRQQRTHVAAHETIQGDYFAFGPVVTISGTVNGDVYASGGRSLSTVG